MGLYRTHLASRRSLGTRSPSGGGASWDPSQLADLEAWYRADDVVLSGSSITTWTDKSGNGRDLTQGTGTAQPTLTTRAGQDVASFDGGDYVQSASFTSFSNPITIYSVFEFDDLSTTRAIHDGGSRVLFRANTTTAYQVIGGGGNFSGGTPAVDTISASAEVYDAASSALYVNDFAASAGTGGTGATTASGLTIGATNSATTPMSGYVWEVVLCSGAHDAATRKLVGDYLTARYSGLTVTT